MSGDPYECYERVLREIGLPRTRENFLYVMYDGNVPEEDWDDEAEEQLPPDLRIT